MFSKVPTVNKRKHPEKGGKRYKMKGPKLWQKEKNTNIGRPQGEHEQIKYWNPPITKNILNKERGTLKKTFSLKEPSHIVTTHLASTLYNVRSTLASTCKTNAKSKEESLESPSHSMPC